MKPLSRALGHLRKYWLVTCGAYVSLLIVTAGNLVTPRLIEVIIDQGITGKNMSVIISMALGLVGLALGRSLFQFAQGYLSERASQGVAYDLRNALYAKIQSLSFSYHDQAQTGQLLTRATNDVELVRMFTGMGFLQFLNSSVFGLKARPMFSRVQKKLSALNIILQENLAGVRVVKAFAREPFEAERFGKSNQELLDEFLKVSQLMAFLFPTLFLVFNLSTLAIYWYGGFQVIGGDLTVGQLVAFNAYLMMVMMPVGIMGMIVTMISRAAASAERIFEILDAQSEVADAPDAQPLPSIEGRVAFEDVRFRYFGSGEQRRTASGERRRTASSKDRQVEISAPDRSVTGQPAGSRTRRERDFPSTEDSEWVLDGVSFVAEPGQTVALLGATGSGKSTIINLIPRFYDVSEGRITVDGHDVRDVTIESLRSQIGIVCPRRLWRRLSSQRRRPRPTNSSWVFPTGTTPRWASGG
jgi:ATP-binding cassette subfamily B protein